jgi:hypothetical protein
MHPILSVAQQLQSFEQDCLRQSERYLTESAAPFAEATRNFDALLQQVYLFSCCFWGCHGKEHVFEHLAGRTVSHAIASHRLIVTGYYDEALSLIRNVGEIANLLNLFWVDNTSIRSWLDGDDKHRRKEFSPVAVRTKLENLKWMVPFDDQHYKRLCELVVHPTRTSRPNAHQDGRRPVLGAYFQPAGFLRASWELYWSLAVVAGPVAKVAIMPQEQGEKMVEVTIPLFELAADHLNEQTSGS